MQNPLTVTYAHEMFHFHFKVFKKDIIFEKISFLESFELEFVK